MLTVLFMRKYLFSNEVHFCVIDLAVAPFPNAVRSTANILDLLSGSSNSNAAGPEVQSPDDAFARHTISTAHVMSQESKRSTVELVKDENFDNNQIVPHCYKSKRLVIFYHTFVVRFDCALLFYLEVQYTNT
jgi:hypothetical protein